MKTQPDIHKAIVGGLIVIATIALTSRPASAQIEFDPPALYAVETFPTSVTAAELNGDGHLDLAVTNEVSNTVTLLFNDGQGGFGTTDSFETGFDTGPFALAAGDFDGDGDNDLAVVNKDENSVSVHLNNGAGIFTLDVTLAVGDTPRSIAVGDLNHDNQPDIVVANRDSNDVSVFLNLGGGKFGPAVNYAAGEDLRQIVIGLLDNDEHPDIAVTSHDTISVGILLNTGTGEFNPVTQLFLGGGDRPEALALGDLNGDGYPDLAVGVSGDFSGSIEILENNGNGLFSTMTSLPASIDVAAIQVGDLNGDGMRDLAAADRIGDTISTYENLGAGQFGTRATIDVAPNPYYMRLGDFAGNGLCDDIAIPNSESNQVTVLISQAVAACLADMSGDGTVDAADLAELLGAWGPNPGHPADFNGDGVVNAADLAQLLGAWGACP